MPTIYLRPNYSAILVGILFLIGCKPTQKTTSSDDLINRLAIEKIGEEFYAYPSPDRSYVLFIEKLPPSSATSITKFIVIESASKKIMFEKSFRPGHLKWDDNSVLELLDAPAILMENEDLSSYIKKIDIASHKN